MTRDIAFSARCAPQMGTHGARRNQVDVGHARRAATSQPRTFRNGQGGSQTGCKQPRAIASSYPKYSRALTFRTSTSRPTTRNCRKPSNPSHRTMTRVKDSTRVRQWMRTLAASICRWMVAAPISMGAWIWTWVAEISISDQGPPVMIRCNPSAPSPQTPLPLWESGRAILRDPRRGASPVEQNRSQPIAPYLNNGSTILKSTDAIGITAH